jgi:SPP1 family predicted phage head-tail adaptor
MDLGKLDRSIILQSYTTSQGATGQPVATWSNFATVWAQKRDLGVGERFRAHRDLAIKATVFIIRYLSGIDAKMRVLYDGGTYDVTGVKEMGRRSWLELTTELQT